MKPLVILAKLVGGQKAVAHYQRPSSFLVPVVNKSLCACVTCSLVLPHYLSVFALSWPHLQPDVLPASVCNLSAHTLPLLACSCPHCIRVLSFPTHRLYEHSLFIMHVTDGTVHIRMENGRLCNSLSILKLSYHGSVITFCEHSSDMSIICVPLLVVKYSILLYLMSTIYLSIHFSVTFQKQSKNKFFFMRDR